MLFFYIRHGDPIYDPNELTPLGKRQAEAIAKRLALYGIDKIYASPSNRAMQTAQPTCEILKKEMTVLDFTDESYAWRDFTVQRSDGRPGWAYQVPWTKKLFVDPSVRALGYEWYDHPDFAGLNFQKGMDRVGSAVDALFAELGYEHIPQTGSYRAVRHNEDRVALFAHEGFGMAFMSHLLDIQYPEYVTHFSLCHTGMTVIEFREEEGISVPNVLTLSSDSHLYREGLPTNYNNRIRF